MSTIDVNNFTEEVECIFEGEKYSVRNNGAVLRHSKEGKRARSVDNQWTFGKENSANTYLLISGARIHRIVATAFHGEPPDPKYVVDHIDSNCRNNRPENLRWLSRLENTLKNPITRKKIEFLCGSIENFLNNPSILNEHKVDQNIEWLRTVTQEEAKNCLSRMTLWAKTENTNVTNKNIFIHKGSFEKRVYLPIQKWEAGLGREPGLDLSLTPWCAQYMWPGQAYFPLCPETFGDDQLDDYYRKLTPGAIIAYSEYDRDKTQMIINITNILRDKSSIIAMCECVNKKYVNIGIELNSKCHFIHFVLGVYSERDEAYNDYNKKQTLPSLFSAALYDTSKLF